MIAELPFIVLGGLLGSSHCVGMCGGFVLTIGLGARSFVENLVRQLLYGLGRLFTYAALGFAAGWMGLWFSSRKGVLVNAQAWLAFVAGAILVTQGLTALGVVPGHLRRARRGSACPAGSAFRSILSSPRRLDVFLAGLLNGFLPCGLVYGALALAASSAAVVRGSLIMAAFGAGTLPLMLLAGLGGSILSLAARRRVFRLAAVCLTALGILSFSRGVFHLGSDASARCPGCARHEGPTMRPILAGPFRSQDNVRDVPWKTPFSVEGRIDVDAQQPEPRRAYPAGPRPGVP
jgi:sulfite exporter TauE/SafE